MAITICSSCGKEKECEFLEGPFSIEGIIEKEPSKWWCEKCYQEVLDDI